MVFSTLSTRTKVSLLSALIVIAVVAVVIPMLAVGRSSESSPPTTYSMDNTDHIQVLRTVNTELENMKIQINSKLDKTEGSPEKKSTNTIPLIIPESDPARVSVDASARPKRQAVSETTKSAVEQQKTVEQTKALTNVEIPASQAWGGKD